MLDWFLVCLCMLVLLYALGLLLFVDLRCGLCFMRVAILVDFFYTVCVLLLGYFDVGWVLLGFVFVNVV